MRHSAMALAGALATSLAFAPAVTAQTNADPTVKVEWTAPIGPFDGNEYVHFEGVMTGTIEREDGSTGTYEVPIEVIYPVDGGNGVAYVDPVNTGPFREHPTLCEWGTYICDEGETERHLNIKTNKLWTRVFAGKWLFEEGYTHIAVQWDKTITDRMGPTPPDGTIRRRLVYGVIEQVTDMYEILFDSARWLRAPSLEGDVPDPEPVDYVVWGGHSQESYMARWFIGDGLSQEDDGSPIFDGYLLSGAGIFCFHPDENPNPSPSPSCSPVPDAAEAKILQFDTQTEIEFLAGWAARDSEGVNLDNYRRWEIAGVSHIPGGTGMDLYFLGHPGNQNPADPGPAYRAAVDAMTNWLKNDEAPSNSPIIEGEVIPPVEEGELPVFATELDDDGNAVGGVRLPHMPRTLDNGDPAGAPVGTYRATLMEELDFEHSATVFIVAAGQLVPFDAEELNARYPTPEAYRDLVVAAADAALDEGFIVQSDYDKYTTPAQRPDTPPLPEPAEESGGSDVGECPGHACPTSPLDLPEGGEVRLELVKLKDYITEVRTHAWFASDQHPDSRPWPRPPENWKIQDSDDLCIDMRDRTRYPSGRVESRTYVDAGETVTFQGGDAPLELQRAVGVQDWAYDNLHDIVYLADIDPRAVVTDRDYDVEIAGSGVVEPQVFKEVIRVPGEYEVTFPDMDEHVLMTRGEEFTFLWSNHSFDPFDFAFVSFSDTYGLLYYCIGPQSGQMTIPASVVEDIPRGGSVLHGLISHRAVEMESGKLEGRRIDFVGVNSRSSSYTVVDRP